MNLLIKPASLKMLGGTPPPLGLLYIAAMDKQTVVWDEVISGSSIPYIREKKPKIVGVQIYTTGRGDGLKLLEFAKSQGCITVAGGPHVAPMYKQMLDKYDFIDYLVSGDGEWPWKGIVDWANGLVTRPERYIRHLSMNLDDLPYPAWDAINVHSYPQERINVMLGRGCSGRCVFCAAWWVHGEYRHHGADWMTHHLTMLGDRGVTKLTFQDDCLTNTESAYEALTTALTNCNTKFRWRGVTRVDKIERWQLYELKKLGCYMLGFGIESGSQTILDKINKGADLERAIKVRQWCKEFGIQFKALMMSGFPFETPETKREDAEFRKRLKPDEWGSVGHIMVLPGTKLYRDLKKEGVISDDFWLGNEPYYRLG